MTDNNIKKLPLKSILREAWVNCMANRQMNLLFAVIAYVMGALALASWKSLLFWPILLAIYVLWGACFRYYLGRKPFFEPRALFNSLVPSTKIVMLSVVVVSVLILLPMIPLFVNINPEFNLVYARFMLGDFEQNKLLFLITDIVFLLISPIMVYRPFLAWISALVGRSGSLRFAWSKTKGNYGEFLLLAVLTNFSIVLGRCLVWSLGGNDYLTLVLAAPLVVYFNVVSIKAYEFFFLDIEEQKA